MPLNLSHIVKFAMHRVPLFKDKTFGNALQLMCNLKDLSLIESPNVTTDAILQIVFQYCTRMEILQLTETKNVSSHNNAFYVFFLN
jgi:hypothetical protein